MEKKLYWIVESKGDLSLTVNSLTTAQIQIECDFDSLDKEDKDDAQYTITPTYLTEEEYRALPEV